MAIDVENLLEAVSGNLALEQPSRVSAKDLRIVVLERDLLGGSFSDAIVQCGFEVCG